MAAVVTTMLGVIADDYTGASDLANTLSRQGLRTVLTIGVPADPGAVPGAEAIVVALKSRSIEPARAVALSRAANRFLRERGAGHVLFKICSTFDSTDCGNIGPVTDALRADHRSGAVLVTPAFPATGRTVFQGHLFVDTVPLDESPLKDHPLNPMRDANLVRVLARQSAHGVGLLPHATVRQGADAIRAARAVVAGDVGALIADAVDDDALETLGEAALDVALSVGASGLGLGLARALVRRAGREIAPTSIAPTSIVGRAGRQVSGAPTPVEPGDTQHGEGRAAIIAGSCSTATLEQIAAVEHRIPTHRLDVGRLLEGGGDEVRRALDWAAGRLGDGPVLIASSQSPDAVRRAQQQHGEQATGERIEAALATIAAGLVERGVTRLVVAGGETSGAVVDRLAIPAFTLGPEIAPGVPVLRAGGFACALKSGNFGGRDFFDRALELL